jgi:LmbE family N-acetylglucosaminyl deacetylase
MQYILNFRYAQYVTSYLWLLPHPDDEVFGLPFLCEPKSKHVIFYLTNGESLREKESRKLHSRSIPNIEVSINFEFATCADGALSAFLNVNLVNALLEKIKSEKICPEAVITTAYQGGHQDHDAANLLGLIIAYSLQIPLVGLSTYSASQKFFFAYSVMPSLMNSKTLRYRKAVVLPKLFFAIISYKSQLRTWLGLSPSIFAHYLFGKFGYQLQSQGDLFFHLPRTVLYEKRKKSTFSYEKNNLLTFMKECKAHGYY